ncbi:MAG: hypothetical protein OEZ08_01375 [Betaproteobacteria bacterium]|nr:hypothetical protein [Betaproteobacteria bacterium]
MEPLASEAAGMVVVACVAASALGASLGLAAPLAGAMDSAFGSIGAGAVAGVGAEGGAAFSPQALKADTSTAKIKIERFMFFLLGGDNKKMARVYDQDCITRRNDTTASNTTASTPGRKTQVSGDTNCKTRTPGLSSFLATERVANFRE